VNGQFQAVQFIRAGKVRDPVAGHSYKACVLTPPNNWAKLRHAHTAHRDRMDNQVGEALFADCVRDDQGTKVY
jgi:hypothetical protein